MSEFIIICLTRSWKKLSGKKILGNNSILENEIIFDMPAHKI